MQFGVKKSVQAIASDTRGNVGTLFSLSAIPLVLAIVAGVDYAHVNARQAQVQQALDSAVIMGLSAAGDGAPSDANTRLAISAAIGRLSDVTLTSGVASTIARNGTTTTNVADANGSTCSYATTVTAQTSTCANTKLTYTPASGSNPASYSVTLSGDLGLALGSTFGLTVPLSLTATAVAGVSSTATYDPTSGQYFGNGSLSEDPVMVGADGSWNIFNCDHTGNTWYNLLSDAGFEINANCVGNDFWSEYYKINILAGAHTIAFSPSQTIVTWYGSPQIGEAWTGAITIDGVTYPAATQSGSNILLNDTSAGITVKAIVGQPGVVGSAANYALITTPTYSVSVAYDSDNIWDNSHLAVFGMANIQIAANGAGNCGVPGGTWGGTLANIDDVNANDFVVSGPNAMASQFNWNCSKTAPTKTAVRLAK